ncbi:hypothetical protein RND71_023070 [Anisodus tanguticus]|uniref:Uncharacterized protein n=1 Tax=Anisodus tanguticus TaxID=243964 RepID=A0AAE1VEF2_9SOLA|nr:hypothetical protein RND71_023070 [Anisodus tanguticus]
MDWDKLEAQVKKENLSIVSNVRWADGMAMAIVIYAVERKNSFVESVMDKLHGHDHSSSDSEDEKKAVEKVHYSDTTPSVPIYMIRFELNKKSFDHDLFYEDKVDAFAEKAEAEIKKQYVVFDANVLSKIPRGPLKGKKLA